MTKINFKFHGGISLNLALLRVASICLFLGMSGYAFGLPEKNIPEKRCQMSFISAVNHHRISQEGLMKPNGFGDSYRKIYQCLIDQNRVKSSDIFIEFDLLMAEPNELERIHMNYQKTLNSLRNIPNKFNFGRQANNVALGFNVFNLEVHIIIEF